MKQVVRQFRFTHGDTDVEEFEENLGIMEVWRRAWAWREGELFVVIEDDVEMSPHWYRALASAWTTYSHLPELAGVGLQKQTFVAAGQVS